MKIIHVMSDGTVRDSIEGVVIPPSNQEAYRILANHVSNKEQKTDQDEVDCA